MAKEEVKKVEGVGELVELLAHSAYQAYSLSLCGAGNSDQAWAYFDRMRKPEVGDLVLECTTMHIRGAGINRVGRLLSVTHEMPPNIEDWPEEDRDQLQPEKTWTIETLDGREFRWINASFIVIPEDPFKLPDRR